MDDIRDDHLSGASEISRRCARHLGTVALRLAAHSPEEYLRRLTEVGRDLIQAQPAMAPVFNAVNSILRGVQEALEGGAGIEELRRVAQREAEGFSSCSLSALERIGEHGASLIPSGGTVLTYSSSGTVQAILERAQREGRDFRVIVPESRPMGEGKELARQLGRRGTPCTLIVDGAISAFIEEVQLVLVGADRVSEHYLINKVGTRGIAILAREFEIPVYSACEISKFLPHRLMPFAEEPKDPGEVCSEPLENVQVVNLYFEPVGLHLFAGIITEEGIWTPGWVREVIRKYPVVSLLSDEEIA